MTRAMGGASATTASRVSIRIAAVRYGWALEEG